MRIMAIDYGDARTGVALSDPTGFLAGQTFLIKSRKQEVVLEELAALMKQQAEKRFAPMVQTAPAPENETDNRAFCI